MSKIVICVSYNILYTTDLHNELVFGVGLDGATNAPGRPLSRRERLDLVHDALCSFIQDFDLSLVIQPQLKVTYELPT